MNGPSCERVYEVTGWRGVCIEGRQRCHGPGPSRIGTAVDRGDTVSGAAARMRTEANDRYDGAGVTQTPDRVDIYRTEAEFDALEDEWRALKAASPDTPYFASFDWCRSWWTWFGAPEGRQMAIVAVRRDGELQVLMPLTVSRALLFGSASLMGEGSGQYSDCLVRPERRSDPLLPKLVAAALSGLGVDRVTMSNCRDDAAIIDLLSTVRRGKTWIRAAEYCNVEVRPAEFDGLDGYMKSRSSSLRKGLRRRRKKLAELGEVVHEQITDPALLGCAAEQMLQLKLAWLRESGLHGRFVGQPGVEHWLPDLMRRAGASGRLHLSVIRVGEHICAAQLAFRSERTLTAYFSAFDTSLSSYAVGKLHLEDHIVEIFKRNLVLDLLPPSDDYKREWGIEGVRVAAYTVPLTALGAAVSAVYSVKSRDLAKKIYMRLPAGMRAAAASALLDLIRRLRTRVAGGAEVRPATNFVATVHKE